jgi:hypothetical protein
VTANQLSAAGNKQPVTARQIVSSQRHTLKIAPPNTGSFMYANEVLARKTGNVLQMKLMGLKQTVT